MQSSILSRNIRDIFFVDIDENTAPLGSVVEMTIDSNDTITAIMTDTYRFITPANKNEIMFLISLIGKKKLFLNKKEE